MSVPAPRKRKRLPCRSACTTSGFDIRTRRARITCSAKPAAKISTTSSATSQTSSAASPEAAAGLISTRGGQLAVSAQPVLRPGPTVHAYGRTSALHL